MLGWAGWEKEKLTIFIFPYPAHPNILLFSYNLYPISFVVG